MRIIVETNDRRLPVGIQSFEEIRKEGYLYVDKTDIIWLLTNRGKKYNLPKPPTPFWQVGACRYSRSLFHGKEGTIRGFENNADGEGMG